MLVVKMIMAAKRRSKTALYSCNLLPMIRGELSYADTIGVDHDAPHGQQCPPAGLPQPCGLRCARVLHPLAIASQPAGVKLPAAASSRKSSLRRLLGLSSDHEVRIHGR